jgi:hypothetical protein
MVRIRIKCEGYRRMQAKTVVSSPITQKGKLLPRCRLCEEVPPRGIRGGYLINGVFICNLCETMILELEAGTEDYRELLGRIKKLWE